MQNPDGDNSFQNYLVDSSEAEASTVSIPNDFLEHLKQKMGIQAEKLSFIITTAVAGEVDQKYFVLYPDKTAVPKLGPIQEDNNALTHGYWRIADGKVIWQPLPH